LEYGWADGKILCSLHRNKKAFVRAFYPASFGNPAQQPRIALAHGYDIAKMGRTGVFGAAARAT
jgi:hypothetical protein